MTEEAPDRPEAGEPDPGGPPRVTTEETIEPTEAFGLLGDELRVSIVRELGAATEGTRAVGLSFADLRKRCDVRDSGRFNYHLQELVGTFVYEDDGNYNLRYPGVLLYEAMQSGALTDRITVEPFGIGRECRECGAELTGSYRDSLFEVSCPDCGHREMKYTLPPGALRSDDPERVAEAAHVYARRDVMAVFEGVCPVCAGEVGREVVPEGEGESDLERGTPGPTLVHTCTDCSKFFTTAVVTPLLHHPAVVAFFHEHGTNVLSTPPWELGFRDGEVATLESTDPVRLRVEFEAPADGAGADGDAADRLRMTVDGDLNVLETVRR